MLVEKYIPKGTQGYQSLSRFFNSFDKRNSGIDKNLTLTSKDRSIIANYLNTCLRIHFEGLGMLKSLKRDNEFQNLSE